MAQTRETTDRFLARAVSRACRDRSRNIYLASFFLPPRKRLAFQAAGAFLHMLQEALDIAPAAASGGGCASGSDLDARAALVLERLDRMVAGEICPPDLGATPDDAVIAVMSAAIARYQIPRQWFLDLINALKLRATKLRYATRRSLDSYLRDTGGSIALILSAILGLTHTEAHERAIDMGMAIQLTRILRDLKKDAQQKRIFLPLEDLIRFRYSEKNLLAGLVNDNFCDLMKFQIDRARDLYRSAAEGIPWVGGDGSRVAAATIAVLYAGLLRAIERKNYDVFRAELKLTTPHRARRMIDAWRLARGGKARGWELR